MSLHSWSQEESNNLIPQQPWNKDECLAKGGEWAFYNMGQFYFCALNTTDNGKACSDSNQCQGDCLPTNRLAKSGEKSSGMCAAMFPMPDGCHMYLVKGKVVAEPCI